MFLSGTFGGGSDERWNTRQLSSNGLSYSHLYPTLVAYISIASVSDEFWCYLTDMQYGI